MSPRRYLVHLFLLCLLCTAAAFAHPFAAAVHEGATYRAVHAPGPVAAHGVTFHQQWLDIEEEMRLLQEDQARFLIERAAREAHAAADCLDAP